MDDGNGLLGLEGSSKSFTGRSSPSSPSSHPPLPNIRAERTNSATSSTALPELYTSLEDFTSKVEIYRGRHSLVWSAVCRQTKKPVIVKAYLKAKMSDNNFHQVKREIRLMQSISHPGSVQLLGSFEDAHGIYLVQESCSKGDLFKRLIRSGGTLEEKFVVGEVIMPLLVTLEYLHERRIVHRDIKPENIFFARDGSMKLGDFGLAIDMETERPKSRVGTLDYMAPEVVSLLPADRRPKDDTSTYDDKVDVWAVGILAYELMVGRPPFEVEDEKETAMKIMYENSLTFPPHVSPEAVKFIRTSLSKTSGVRPGASELLQHPWVKPHYQKIGGGVEDPLTSKGGFKDFKGLSVVIPSTGASSSSGAVTCGALVERAHSFSTPFTRQLPPLSPTTPTPTNSSPLSATLPCIGPEGRSESFSMTNKRPQMSELMPTSKPAGSKVPSSPSNQLLKSALNQQLSRMNLREQGAGSVSNGHSAPLLHLQGNAQQQQQQQHHGEVPASVKARLKQYFVARNT